MSLNINFQNTENIIKVPFPPTTGVGEIVDIHLKNGIKNVNHTINSFMIYRKEYNIVAKFNLSSKDISKFASISWQNEPEDVKNYYRQMAKDVKKCFKEKVTSLCFINSDLASTNNNQDVSNPSLKMDQNFPHLSPPLNTEQNSLSMNDLLTIDDDKFMDYLSEEDALTYKVIIQEYNLWEKMQ